MVTDGVLAENDTQLQNLWSLRESIPESAAKLGKVYKYDLSLPVGEMYTVVEEVRKRFADLGLDKDGPVKGAFGFGHFGDGRFPFLRDVAFELTSSQGTSTSTSSRSDGIQRSKKPSSRGSTSGSRPRTAASAPSTASAS